jgi:hypothetical protein
MVIPQQYLQLQIPHMVHNKPKTDNQSVLVLVLALQLVLALVLGLGKY